MNRLLLVLFILGVLGAEGVDDKCKLKADVVFLVDSSRSIHPNDYKLQVKFLGKLTGQMNVSPAGTHVGAISFSRGGREEFYPTDYMNENTLQNKIQDIPFMAGGSTHTYEGLRMARKMLKTGRKGIPHIIIIVTDGNSSNRRKTRDQADMARKEGIKVFAVGIGPSVDYGQLSEMATENTKTYVHTVSSFESLQGLRSVLIPAACNVVTTTRAPVITTTPVIMTKPEIPETTPGGTGGIAGNEQAQKLCTKKKADVVFVLDKSSSIKLDNFKKQLNFVNGEIGIFTVSKDHTHVSVVTYDYEPKVEFYLNEYFTHSQMRQAVSKIKYTAGSTNTHLALEKVATDVLTPERGARKGIALVVIVVTDGKSSDEAKTREWAEVLKRKFGAYVFAIGVGKEIDRKELEAMASKDASKHVFHVKGGYTGLTTLKTILATRACEVQSGDLFVRCQQNSKPSQVIFVNHFAHASLKSVDSTTNVIRSVAGGIMTSSGKVKVGVTSSPCVQVKDVGLGASPTAKQFATDLKINNTGALAPVLSTARKQLSDKKKQRVMVLTVHGPIGDLKQAQRQMKLAHFMGVKVVVVGRDRAVKGELMNLVNQRKGSDVRVLMESEITAGRFGTKTPLWQDVLARVCQGLSPGQQFD